MGGGGVFRTPFNFAASGDPLKITHIEMFFADFFYPPIVKTPTLPQHRVGFDNIMTVQTPPHPPPTQTQCHQYLSCY